MEYNKIIHGCCIEEMQLFSPEVFDCIVTSPPYNAQKSYEKDRQSQDEFWEFTENWIHGTYRVLKTGGAIFINTGYVST